MKAIIVGLLLACAALQASAAAPVELSHGRFERVRIHAPSRTVEQFVIVLAGANEAQARAIATALSARGALVAVVNTQALFANLERDGASCVSPNGDLVNLSHFVQAVQRLPGYHKPILVGEDEGAAFVYAMLAQSPPGTFAGGISLRFCPELALRKPLCKSNALDYRLRSDRGVTLLPVQLESQWVAIDAPTNKACEQTARDFERTAGVQPVIAGSRRIDALVTSYTEIASTIRVSAPPSVEEVADLPIVDVPAKRQGDAFAIMLSGDGGWAEIDEDVSSLLAEKGIAVVGVDSLRYFWNERTPEDLARDLTRVMDAYARQWQRRRVVLIGYSQGADVLPFAINRFDASTRRSVALAVMIGLGEQAQFEFHLGSWFGFEKGLPIAPELARIRSTPLLCIYGEDDEDSGCRTLDHDRMQILKLPGGHHFDGDYERLADAIIERVTR